MFYTGVLKPCKNRETLIFNAGNKDGKLVKKFGNFTAALPHYQQRKQIVSKNVKQITW